MVEPPLGVVMAMIEVRLLGGFEVKLDGEPVPNDAWRRRRAANLVKILALEQSHRLHREQIMNALWPDLAPEAAAANLRKAVHYARKALRYPRAISSFGGVVQLGAGTDLSVDSVQFETMARTALRSRDPVSVDRVAELYLGELLPGDRYEPWAADARERLRTLALQTLKSAGRWVQVLEIDPADEDAHRALIREALDDGDRTRAVRQFQTLRQRLRMDLGMGPDPRSVRLYERAVAASDEPVNGVQRVRVLLARAFVQLTNGQLDLADDNAGEARLLSLTNGLSVEYDEATALQSMIANLRGRWRDLFRAEFAAAVERPKEIAARVFDAHLCVIEYHVNGPDGHEGMVDYANGLRRLAAASGSAQGEGIAEYLMGESELFSGHMASAGQHLQAAVDLLAEAGATAAQVFAMQRLAEHATANGNEDRAHRLLRNGLRLASSSELAPHLVVRMHEGLVRSTHDSSARAAIRAGEEDLAVQLFCRPCSIGFRVASATALAALGDVVVAQKHLAVADDIATMWPDGFWHAAVIEARGALRRAGGNESDSTNLFSEAADRYARLNRPIDAARCRLRTAGASADKSSRPQNTRRHPTPVDAS
jgi:DNA-binding SARP family transcriptional activator